MAEELKPNTEPRRAEPFTNRPQAVIATTNITEQGAQNHERTENDRAMTARRYQVNLSNERPYEEVPSEEDNDKEPTVLPVEKTEQ